MTVAKIMPLRSISLRRSLQYAGGSRKLWHYTVKPREIPVNHDIAQAVQEEAFARPTYGTRRMAAAISRKIGRLVNHKQVQRIYRKLAGLFPQKTKSEIIRSGRKMLRPASPDRLWEADMTYIWCGTDRWCYLFNAVDTFTRKWVGYSFDVFATKDTAIQCVVNAVASEKPDASKLTIRTDNGSQYISKKFRESITILGARQEFIYRHTPEQNGHIKSFHHTLKKEYV